MKSFLFIFSIVIFFSGFAQEKVNPVIGNFGGIYDIPKASVKPNPSLEYKIVIDVYGGARDSIQIDRSINNVARMLNLHAVGGVPPEQMKVVLAIHGKSTYSILSDESYKSQFGLPNPNTLLLNDLKAAGVIITVCGQSLIGRGFTPDQLHSEVDLATSMLTTVTTYQMMGYQLLQF